MIGTIFLILLAMIFFRYVVPFLIMAVSGMISKDDAMVAANKQNVFDARKNETPFAVNHIVERVATYIDILMSIIILFFPKISFPFVITLMCSLLVQLFMCSYSMKNGSAYTWLLAPIFRKRSMGNYSSSISGNIRNNNYNRNYQNSQHYNQIDNYDYNRTRQQRNITGQMKGDIKAIGKRSADGTIQEYPVWSVNSSKKCFITEGGMVIFKNNNQMRSVTGKNVTERGKDNIFLFENSDVDAILELFRTVKPVVRINADNMAFEELYITDQGVILETPYPDSNYPAVSRVFGDLITIKNIGSDYYVAEYKEKDEVILSKLKKNGTGYSFTTLIEGCQETIKLGSDFKMMEEDDSVTQMTTTSSNTVSSATSTQLIEQEQPTQKVEMSEEDIEAKNVLSLSIDTIKTTASSISSLAIKINDERLKNKPLGGLGKDGVFNDGTVDVMCHFGELLVYAATNHEPEVKSLIVAKLLPKRSVIDIKARIGNDWTTVGLEEFTETTVEAVNDVIDMAQSSLVNYWLTDEENIYYVSIVIDASEKRANNNSNAFGRKLLSCLTKAGINESKNVGYREYLCNADVNKFKDGPENSQSYFNINPLSMHYDLLVKYLTKVEKVNEVFKSAIVRANLSFRANIVDAYSYGSGEDESYGVRLKMKGHIVHDWIRNKDAKSVVMKTTGSSPAKIKEALYDSIKGNKVKQKIRGNTFEQNFLPIFAFVYYYDRGDEAYVNFLFTKSDNNFEYTYEHLLDTPLIAYACYTEQELQPTYMLSEDENREMTVLVFNREKGVREDVKPES